MNRILTACSLFAILSTHVSADEPIKLFNGKNLDGWTGDQRLWSVKDGAIVGSTEGIKLKHNSFLSTTKEFGDFELSLKFKLRNHNSGIQYRSAQFDDHVVRGYQADIAEKRYMGILYEEGGRGILADVKAEKVAPHIKKDDWNEYTITARGPKIVQKINGITTVEYMEKSPTAPLKGIIALQLHTGPDMKVYFKDIVLTPLPE